MRRGFIPSCGLLVLLLTVSVALLGGPRNVVIATDSLALVRFGCTTPQFRADIHDGILYRDGILAAFQEFNDDLRPDKRFRVELVVLDDNGDLTISKTNVQKFVADPSILGVIGILGTSNAELAAPVAFAAGLPVLAQYGGVALRHPFQRDMINLRASLYDEAAALVEYLFHVRGRSRIAFFRQSGRFGNVTRDGVLAALDSNNLYLQAYTVYTEKGNASLWYKESLAALDIMETRAGTNEKIPPPDGIIIAADIDPASVFLPLARARFPDAVLACFTRVSVVDLMARMYAKPETSGVLNGLIISQVVPLATDRTTNIVQEYQAAMNHVNQTEYTFGGLEGYLMGKLAIQVLEQIPGITFTSEQFLKALYSRSSFNLNGLRLGPFVDSSTEDQNGFDGLESCNQGMRQVIMTTILPNKTLVREGKFSFDTCGYQTRQWRTLYFGQSCTFSGPLSPLCVSFRDGVLAAFKKVNDAGGIRGTTRLKLVTKEDYGNASISLANNLAFMDDPSIFALIGASSIGIEEVARLAANRTDNILFGAFDGEIDLREPFRAHIVNFRASVRDEVFAIVHHCYYKLKASKISVLYEATSFGAARRNHVAFALDEKRFEIYSQAAYDPTNMTQAIASLFAGQADAPEAVVFIGLDDVFGDAVVSVHSHNRKTMVFGLSKTITTQLLLADNIDKVNWEKVLLTAVVPDATNQDIEVVAQYTSALKDMDSTYKPSAAGLEGYVVAQLLAISLNSIIGEDLTVENLLSTIYDHGIFKVSSLRCGPLLDRGSTVSSCNQCMKEVYLVGFEKNNSLSNTSSATLNPFVFDNCMYARSINMDFHLEGSRVVYLSIASVGNFYTLLIMLLLVKYRNNPHVSKVSVRFAIVSCIGALLCFSGVFLLYPVPSDFTCGFGPWLGDLAFVTLFGPIFAKTYRIDKLLNGKKLKRQVITDYQVFRVFFVVLMGFVAFLMVYSIVDQPRMQESFTFDHVRYEQCATSQGIFDKVDILLKALVLLWGCFLCQRVYKISGRFARFNESKELVVCIYHTTFLGVCLLLIGWTTSDRPNARYGIISALVVENTLMVVSVLYGRPILFAIENRAIVDNSDASSQEHEYHKNSKAGKRVGDGKVVAGVSCPRTGEGSSSNPTNEFDAIPNQDEAEEENPDHAAATETE